MSPPQIPEDVASLVLLLEAALAAPKQLLSRYQNQEAAPEQLPSRSQNQGVAPRQLSSGSQNQGAAQKRVLSRFQSQGGLQRPCPRRGLWAVPVINNARAF